jgi:hypothetical protein
MDIAEALLAELIAAVETVEAQAEGVERDRLHDFLDELRGAIRTLARLLRDSDFLVASAHSPATTLAM